jgi:hypothetical protein
MEAGWIYVLVNSSIPGMAKVGRTMRRPADRVAELSAATGVATPFVLAFDHAVADCHAAERAVHDELDRRGWRVAPNREFFRGSPSDIIRVVLDVAEGGGGVTPATPDHSAAALLAAGDRCLLGLGSTLQDGGEALRCYKLAAARGALTAYERLGEIYGRLYAARPDRASRRRALAPLKEGARRGNPYCYAGMAMIFAAERHAANFTKAWGLFFAAVALQPTHGTAVEQGRLASACCQYIDSCLGLGLRPGHLDALARVADAIISTLLGELDRLGRGDRDRNRVVRALRWAYQSLAREAPVPRRRPVAGAQMAWLSHAEAVHA